jgi:hypothetical protein
MSIRDRLRHPGTALAAVVVVIVATPIDEVLLVAIAGSLWYALPLLALGLAIWWWRRRS